MQPKNGQAAAVDSRVPLPRKKPFICEAAPRLMRKLILERTPRDVAARTILFVENEQPRGVFILCDGEVKISIGNRAGKMMILGIYEPGEVLGLNAVILGKAHEVTAQTVSQCRVVFISREEILQFFHSNPDALQFMISYLARNYESVYEQLRMVGLAGSVAARLARLILSRSPNGGEKWNGGSTGLHLTHDEIAGFIGTSRETVTRTLAEFKNRRLIRIQGSTLVVVDRAALEAFAAA